MTEKPPTLEYGSVEGQRGWSLVAVWLTYSALYFLLTLAVWFALVAGKLKGDLELLFLAAEAISNLLRFLGNLSSAHYPAAEWAVVIVAVAANFALYGFALAAVHWFIRRWWLARR